MVERARLESVYTGNCIGGSNPPLSAKQKSPTNIETNYYESSAKHGLSGDSWRLVYECSEFGLFYFKSFIINFVSNEFKVV